MSATPIESVRLSSPPELKLAEKICARLTRQEARNFYWGLLALPWPKRVAVYSLYSFARQLDDEVDNPRGGGQAGLARQRRRLQACLKGEPEDAVMLVLGKAIERYSIPPAELEGVIDGVEMDLGRRRYRNWRELASYCRLVAGSIGRTCVRIFGYSHPLALRHADHLGLAFQLTNILRDVREDAGRGRFYLPQNELEHFELSESELLGPRPGLGWERLMAFEVKRARRLYEEGLQVCEYLPSSSAACVRMMAGIYRQILERIAHNPRRTLTTKVTLSTPAKLSVAARLWLSR